MKKLPLLLCVLSLLVCSCKSKEEKANQLIKQEMFKTLFDYESYEPIETQIDSAFTTLYRDTTAMVLAYLLKENSEEVDKYLANGKSARRKIEIWSNGRYTYGIEEYKEAVDELKKNYELIKTAMEERKIYREQLKTLAEEFKPEFIGWQATHKFRCKNKGGNFSIGNYLYIFDKDIKNIIYQEDLEDDDIMDIKVHIDVALSYEEDEDEEEEDED